MPEIKHNFSAGKMNKDLDERLVPNGEYRNALNIQVKTTDGDSNHLGDAGTVQNLKGNYKIGSSQQVIGYDGNKSKIIGSVSDDATNSAYFFTAAPVPLVGAVNLWPEGVVNIDPTDITSQVIWSDSIMRVKLFGDGYFIRPIIVDRFAVTDTKAGTVSCDEDGDINNSSVYKSNGSFESTPTDGYDQIQVLSGTKYRIGMRIYAQTSSGTNLFSDGDNEFVEILQISSNVLTLSKQQTANLNTAVAFKFVHPERVLEFDYHKEGFWGGVNVIPAIHILDDLLMWTDGKHEPKKINIERCLRGTNQSSYFEHTQLKVKHPLNDGLVTVSDLENLSLFSVSSDIKKENITTIKIAPTSPPNVTMKSVDRENTGSFPLVGYEFVIDADGGGVLDAPPKAGDLKSVDFPSVVDFRLDDVYLFTADNTVDPIVIRAKIVDDSPDPANPNTVTIELLLVDSDLSSSQNPSSWSVELEKREPLFSSKFGRFAYRYQYEDNEYSTFSPWSELVFLPGDFLYTPNKGFNEGMVNTVRQLTVKDFIPNNYIRPHDVKSIDVLWKTTDNSNIYIVKSIVREIDTEWKNFSDSGESNTGFLTVTSEMIYKVVEANQLLRAWDNVPRNAVAQEITGNRLLYGNYTQGYDIKSNIGLKQTLVSDVVSFPKPKKSVKSLRTYQFGVVIGDRYGRETPVISNGYNSANGQVLPGASKVSKSLSKFSNKFKLKQSWDGSNPTDMRWMDYIKYYVKETSNEYYNLVLDRWYEAGDDNIWLSFNSADRNKVDEETYLILKNEHGGQGAVEEEAKYKILAIENEAPDYIKTDNREFDLVQIDSVNIYGANWPNDASGSAITDAVPSALIDNKKIKSADLNLENLEFKGTPKIRIVAKFTTGSNTYEAKSPIKTVSRIINEDEDKSIVIRNTFNLGEVNMYQKILTQLPDASTLAQATADTESAFKYYIQLIDAVVENKAQFDGKFFAKVANDNTLQERILGNSLGEYEVLNSYQIAYIANEITNPSQVSEYASEMDYEASTWDNYITSTPPYTGDPNIFTSSTIANFGPNDSSTTEDFWVNWYENANRTADIFIDQAPAFSGFNLQSNTGQDALTEFNSGTSEINTDSDNVTNWQPQGLSNGTYEETVWNSDNNMGQLTFSMIGGVNNAMWNGTNSYFKTKMQSQGTLFRFRDDPNQEVYRVFQSEQSVSAGGVVPGGPINITSENFDNDGTSDYVNRETIIVRFQRLDNNGNSTGSGLDASVWDPRGTIKHNGLGSLTIEFVQRTQVQNLSDDSISSNSACFETEPKEDVGLDIYYEASGAVPIRLSQRYIQTFTGPNKVKENASLFTVDDRKLVSGRFVKVDLENEPYVYQTIGEDVVHIKRTINGSNTNLKTIITDSISDGICPAVDDIVSFRNLSGLVTKSKILDHVKLLSTAITIPSDRATFSNANVGQVVQGEYTIDASGISNDINSNSIIGAEVTGDGIEKGTFVKSIANIGLLSGNSVIILTRQPSTTPPFTSNVTITIVTGYFEIEKEVWQYPVELGWFNCYSFGNGVESDRIKDDFNTPQIDNGVKASSTFLEYGEEKKGSGMIFSGLYNSTSSVNNLNQFIQAEKITKDLNTTHGSIQAMKTRDNDVVVFTEDKVLKVMSSGKDAVFNADNKPQLTATDAVLGTAMPFSGDYGISKNPESLAFDSYRMYFTDTQRGAVLRLSGNGITPISDIGMKSYFRETLKKCDNLIGSFDGVSDEYNLTLDGSSKWQFDPITASFSESSKGWVSFKSFAPLTAISVNDKYFSVDLNNVYVHYSDDVIRNYFYDQHYTSEVEVLFNESPGSVKSFTTVNYEGSQAKIEQFTSLNTTDAAGNSITLNDGEYYNLSSKLGWYVDSIETNLQSGAVGEFMEKENKWFNKISGDTTTENNLDTSEFTVQGIGFPLVDPTDTQTEENVIVQGVDADNNPL